MSVAIDSAVAHTASLPPGPRLPRALQAVLWTWRYEQFSDRSHERYGDTFTIKLGALPTGVLTTDRDAIRRLFTGEPLIKRHANDILRPIVGEQSVLLLEPSDHLTRRKLLLPPFHGERVQSYVRLMQRLVCAELDQLETGQTITIQPIAQALTLDVILNAVLGISDVRMRRRLRNIFDSMVSSIGNFALLVPWLSRRSRWNVLAAPYWRLKDELDALLFEHIASSRADEHLSEREDILAMMVMARDEDGGALTDEQLRDELITLITAGHETTATAIAWGVELLVHNPSVLDRARDCEDDYLDALVKEILRIRSPVAIGGGREVLEPFTIGEWQIPAGMGIFVDAYGVHHNPDIYPEPHSFRPERFLDEPPDGYSFLPFGGGAHRCLGASLALLEIKVVLREILKRFELQPAEITIARPSRRGVTFTPRGGARVRIAAEREGWATAQTQAAASTVA